MNSSYEFKQIGTEKQKGFDTNIQHYDLITSIPAFFDKRNYCTHEDCLKA